MLSTIGELLMKIFLFVIVLLVPIEAFAQQAIVPCVQIPQTNGGFSCVPISSTNPLPVTKSK